MERKKDDAGMWSREGDTPEPIQTREVRPPSHLWVPRMLLEDIRRAGTGALPPELLLLLDEALKAAPRG